MNLQAFVAWFKQQLVFRGLIPPFVEVLVGILDDREFDEYSFLDNKSVHISRDGQSIVTLNDSIPEMKRRIEDVFPGDTIVYSKPKPGTNHAVFWTSYTRYAKFIGVEVEKVIAKKNDMCMMCHRILHSKGYDEFIPSEHLKK